MGGKEAAAESVNKQSEVPDREGSKVDESLCLKASRFGRRAACLQQWSSTIRTGPIDKEDKDKETVDRMMKIFPDIG